MTYALIFTLKQALENHRRIGIPGCKRPERILAMLKEVGVEGVTYKPMTKTVLGVEEETGFIFYPITWSDASREKA